MFELRVIGEPDGVETDGKRTTRFNNSIARDCRARHGRMSRDDLPTLARSKMATNRNNVPTVIDATMPTYLAPTASTSLTLADALSTTTILTIQWNKIVIQQQASFLCFFVYLYTASQIQNDLFTCANKLIKILQQCLKDNYNNNEQYLTANISKHYETEF